MKENYVTKVIKVPNKVPYARIEDELKEIQKLVTNGTIEPVGDQPTELCAISYF